MSIIAREKSPRSWGGRPRPDRHGASRGGCGVDLTHDLLASVEGIGDLAHNLLRLGGRDMDRRSSRCRGRPRREFERSFFLRFANRWIPEFDLLAADAVRWHLLSNQVLYFISIFCQKIQIPLKMLASKMFIANSSIVLLQYPLFLAQRTLIRLVTCESLTMNNCDDWGFLCVGSGKCTFVHESEFWACCN